MKIRLVYTKLPEVRYISHLDTVKTFERSIRRAKIPIAYSEGFNPHPKMSFGSALAVGVTSNQEYLDIDLREAREPEEVKNLLNQHLPGGFRIIDSREAQDKSDSLMALLNVAEYEVSLSLTASIQEEELATKLKDYLQREEVEILKETKKSKRNNYRYPELKPKNIRSGIYEVKGRIEGNKIFLDVKLRTGSTGNVRPEDVASTFIELEMIPVDMDTLRIHRTGLYIWENEENLSPLEYN
jgi:radical SAM-linked protein